MPLQLLFIRHAQSIGNQQQKMQGQGNDGLSEQGKQQTHQLAQQLAAETWIPTHAYSSPLARARQTVEQLMTALAVKDNVLVTYRDELQEFQNGIFDGLTWAEAKAIYPQLCHNLESSVDWLAIPGAESLQEGRDRARRFIQLVLNSHHNDDRLWIVSHSWIMQHLIAELMGCDRTWGIEIPNTGLFEFWLDLDRWQQTNQNRFNSSLWQIRRFNSDRHLACSDLSPPPLS